MRNFNLISKAKSPKKRVKAHRVPMGHHYCIHANKHSHSHVSLRLRLLRKFKNVLRPLMFKIESWT